MAAYGRSRLYRRRAALSAAASGPDHHPRRELLSGDIDERCPSPRSPAGSGRGLQRHAFGRRNAGRMRRGKAPDATGSNARSLPGSPKRQARAGLRRDRAVGSLPKTSAARPAAQDGAQFGRATWKTRQPAPRWPKTRYQPCAASTCSRSKTSPGVPRRCATAAGLAAFMRTGTRPSTPWRGTRAMIEPGARGIVDCAPAAEGHGCPGAASRRAGKRRGPPRRSCTTLPRSTAYPRNLKTASRSAQSLWMRTCAELDGMRSSMRFTISGRARRRRFSPMPWRSVEPLPSSGRG